MSNRISLILDTGALTRRQRKVKGKPDVWYITDGRTLTYLLAFVRCREGFVCWWLETDDLDELIEECQTRGLKGVRGVV